MQYNGEEGAVRASTYECWGDKIQSITHTHIYTQIALLCHGVKSSLLSIIAQKSIKPQGSTSTFQLDLSVLIIKDSFLELERYVP